MFYITISQILFLLCPLSITCIIKIKLFWKLQQVINSYQLGVLHRLPIGLITNHGLYGKSQNSKLREPWNISTKPAVPEFLSLCSKPIKTIEKNRIEYSLKNRNVAIYNPLTLVILYFMSARYMETLLDNHYNSICHVFPRERFILSLSVLFSACDNLDCCFVHRFDLYSLTLITISKVTKTTVQGKSP